MTIQIAQICTTLILLQFCFHCLADDYTFGEDQKDVALKGLKLIDTEIIRWDQEIKTPLSRYKDIVRAFATATMPLSVKTLIDRSVMNLEKPFNALTRTVKEKYKEYKMLAKKPALMDLPRLREQFGKLKFLNDVIKIRRKAIKMEINFVEAVGNEFDLLYQTLEKKYLEMDTQNSFTVYEYELLALHDHLNRATVELVKLTSELLRHFDDAESEMWQQKRFVIWAIVEEIFKPLLRNVGDKIGPHPPYNFNAFMRYIENELKIPNGWIDLEKHTVGFDLLQSQIRVNAGNMWLFYAQMSKGTKLFDFEETEENLAKRSALAKEVLDGTFQITEHHSSLVKKEGDQKLRRVPSHFGELIYDEFMLNELGKKEMEH